ncbi:MAG: hypothetical protein NC084_00020 [Bacteroides sp.]|nr:hypothetical protein [Eubacterium sp.]MCM1417308.1 hypothetical protein [Roseburia sp.]MCM1461072.1 hypothetical protein [Bacteroides sp.]
MIQTRDIISFSIVNKNGKSIQKRIAFVFDVTPYCVKLDYRQFELAIYNISKLSLFLTRIGSISSIEISTLADHFVNVYSRIPLQQNEPLLQYRVELYTVKRIFKNFGGRFDFYEQEGFLVGSGYFRAEFSKNIESVAKRNRLKRNREFEELLDRNGDPKKYRPIYDNETEKMFLHAPSEHWTEEFDKRVRFAKQFFEGANLSEEEEG